MKKSRKLLIKTFTGKYRLTRRTADLSVIQAGSTVNNNHSA